MLTIDVLGEEYWDSEAERFRYPDAFQLQFEHSLVSLSKWESIHHKPFLTKDQKSQEEMASYIFCMLLSSGHTPEVLNRLTEGNLTQISEYINNPMTGTTIAAVMETGRQNAERLSSELIYFWMSQYQIAYEARHWHLNQLFTLIRIHHAKSQKPKKMSQQKNAQTMAELNAQRKKKLGTSG